MHLVGSSSNVQGELAVCQISSASGLDIAVEVAVAGASAPYRWVGIARQDCSYEPEPATPRSVMDTAPVICVENRLSDTG